MGYIFNSQGRPIGLILALALLVTGPVQAQAPASMGQVAARIGVLQQQGVPFPAIPLVTAAQADGRTMDLWREAATRAEVVEMNMPAVTMVLGARPATMAMSLPAPGGTVTLELERWDPLADDFVVTTSSGATAELDAGVHYKGRIQGSSQSVAGMSVFRDEVVVMASDVRGTLVMGRLKNADEGTMVVYWDRDLVVDNPLACGVQDNGPPIHPSRLEEPSGERTTKCVKLYWEVNYPIFQDKGSVSATTNFVTALFNQVAILYDNDGIDVQLQQVLVWDTPSPYTGPTSGDYLDQFFNNLTTYNGDLAGLLSYGGGGGIAWVDVLCYSDPRYRSAYSGISEFFVNVPTYSWSVMVIAHEHGHNMGSPHTHSCAWNGNGTAIDGCGVLYSGDNGGCAMGPIPSAGGTVMSYCHLYAGVGINLSLGFGPQPHNLLMNSINASSCLAQCGQACNHPWAGQATGITTTGAVLGWQGPPSSSYTLQWRLQGAPAWTTVSGLGGTSHTLGGLTPNTAYEFQVRTNCAGGATSAWAGPWNFSTACLPFDIPFSENFNTASAPAFPNCWSVQDLNGFSTWRVATEVNTFGSPAARYTYNHVDPANDWFFTPGLNLEGGKTYRVSYDYAGYSGYQEKLKVAYGTAPSASAMTQVIVDHGQFPGGIYSAANNFTPATTGVYYLGWHAYSNADQYLLDVDNILIVGQCSGMPEPGSVPSSAVTCPGGNAVLNATGMAMGLGISYQWQESPDGIGNWAAVVGGIGPHTPSYTTTAINGTRYFRMTTTCAASSMSSSTGTITVTSEGVCYCTPTANANDATGLTNVTFNTIDNSTGTEGTYANHLDISTTVVKGNSYDLAVRMNTGGNYTAYAMAWIDWNQDGTFSTTEMYELGPATNTTNGASGLSPLSVTVPATANTGLTRMRVRAGYWIGPGACSNHDYSEAEDYTIIVADDAPAYLQLDLHTFLQGPFNAGTGLMADHLRVAGLIPLQEPYTGLGFAHVGGGGEATTGPVLATTGSQAVVDWVFVELRDASASATVLATRSGLLLRNGAVVDVDGSSALAFELPPGSYHVAVRHRNHLGIMTAAPLTFGATAITVDFTLPGTPTYGTEPRVQAGTYRMMWMGSINDDGAVKYTGFNNDRDLILLRIGGNVPSIVVPGYFREDCTMDGQVKYTGEDNDRDLILQVIGGGSPNNIRYEQLPD